MTTQTFKANQVVTLVDSNATAIIKGYSKGWYTIFVNGEEKKVRAKTIDKVTDSGKRSLEGQMKKYRHTYEPAISSGGHTTKTCGDEIAHLFEGATPEEVITAAERVAKLEVGELAAKYAKLNQGQARMCAGNRIRAALKRGDISYEDIVAAFKA